MAAPTDGSPADDRREQLLTGDEYAIESGCSREEFLAVAKVYAREIVDAFDLTVTVSNLTWDVSKRAKRRAGAVEYRDGEPERIVLTWEQFADSGWEPMAATIRHELIHVHLLNEGVGPGHGDAFRELASILETPVHCDRFADPAYWVECTDCETSIARYRKSKLVKQPDQYRCRECGGTFAVRKND
jgi:SprT-like protein